MINNLKDLAYKPVDIAGLAVIRILFGFMIMLEAWSYSGEMAINSVFSGQIFYFKYRFFEWVHPVATLPMQLILILYGLAGLAVLLGIFYHAAAFTVTCCISYMFLIDSANYLNHFYLIIIFSALMIFLPAHKSWSLYAWLYPKYSCSRVASWTVWALRAQLIIVYSYAALAKMNVDWMNGMPLYDWIGDFAPEQTGLISLFLSSTLVIYLFTYGGLLYDLLVIPALLYKPTRALAYCMSIGFHLMNFYLFNIGIFPWFMLATTTIFFATSWPREFLNFFWPERFKLINLESNNNFSNNKTLSYVGFACLAAHICFQIIFPLRHFIYPGYVGWSEEGHNFSWHMKLRDKTGTIVFTVKNPTTGKSEIIDNSRFLMRRQIYKMACRPYLALQFAHFLRDLYSSPHETPVEVYADTWISLNGRDPQRLIDPTVNLSELSMKESHNSWILPLRQPVWNAFNKKNRFGDAFNYDIFAQKALLPLQPYTRHLVVRR